MRKHISRPEAGFRRSAIALASAALLGSSGAVYAFPIDAPPEWKINFDNTVLYNLGSRARDVDSRIGNNPVFAESDYRFSKRGDIVTNRVSLLSEFDAVYDRRYGMRLSASGWKDFAYDDTPRTNPGYFIDPNPGIPPGLRYASNYNNGEYSSYTKRYHVQGAELLDAFAFANFDLGGRPATVKLGKLTQFWGNALFFSGAGISYSQSASDLIKQATAPGTQAKELAMPRGQLNFSTQISDELQVGAQYFLQWQADRMPSGGTYLGVVDFLFEGPDRFGLMDMVGAPPVLRQHSATPNDRNGNFGLQAKWSPEWVGGSMGFYYRQFDETQPWNPIFGFGVGPSGPYLTGYRLSYPTKVKMAAVSLDKQIAGASVGLELSYRKNTGLNTNGQVFSPTDPDMSQGARGDTLNMVANVLSILDRTPLYNTGTALAEIAVVHKVRVTDQAARYQGVGEPGCATGTDRYAGCSTDTAVLIGGLFEPQWLQVAPGWDLSTPLFGMYGLWGNAASNAMPLKQGDITYSIGVKGVLQQRYNFALAYNGYHGHTSGMTNAGASQGVPNGVPGFAQYYATGNNMYQFNDRNWLSFTFSAAF